MKDTKPNRVAVVDQVARFGAIEPLSDAQLVELTKTAVEHFETREALELAVDAWLQNREGVPRPFELKDLAELARRLSRKRMTCDGSCDDGWVIRTDRRKTLDGVRDVPVAYPCVCRPPIPREQTKNPSSDGKLPVSATDIAKQMPAGMWQ